MAFIGSPGSYFYDAGYSITGTFYDQTGSIGTSPIPSTDIYANRGSIGIYMINGGWHDTTMSITPIYGTASNLKYLGAADDVDNAYLVYPGFGFILYPDVGYGGNESRTYYNTGTEPAIFYNDSGSSWGSATPSTLIINNNNNPYGTDKTSSIKVFYRGQSLLPNIFA